MQSPEEQEVLASLSILSPPSGRPDEDGRVRLHLRQTKTGRYRWFHKDGSPTVVAESSVENALRAANFAWRTWDLRVEKELKTPQA